MYYVRFRFYVNPYKCVQSPVDCWLVRGSCVSTYLCLGRELLVDKIVCLAFSTDLILVVSMYRLNFMSIH